MCVYTGGWRLLRKLSFSAGPRRPHTQDIKRTTHKSPHFFPVSLMGAHIFAIGFFIFCWVFESLYVVRFFLFSTFFPSTSPFRCTVCKFLWLFRQPRSLRERQERAVRTIFFSLCLSLLLECLGVFPHTDTIEKRRTSSWRPPSATERQGVAQQLEKNI